MNNFFAKKRVLVTGACGTVGSELTGQLLEDYNALEVVGIDNNESELFFLEQKFSSYTPLLWKIQLLQIRTIQGIIILRLELKLTLN